MPEYRAPIADMQYLLTQVFDAESVWQSIPAFSHCNAELATTVLDEGARICQQLIAPISRPGDEEGVRLEDGNVKTAKGYKEAYKTFAENGWMSLGGNPDYDGQGLPKMLTNIFTELQKRRTRVRFPVSIS